MMSTFQLFKSSYTLKLMYLRDQNKHKNNESDVSKLSRFRGIFIDFLNQMSCNF